MGKGQWEEKEEVWAEWPAEGQGVAGAGAGWWGGGQRGGGTVPVKEKELKDPSDGLGWHKGVSLEPEHLPPSAEA